MSLGRRERENLRADLGKILGFTTLGGAGHGVTLHGSKGPPGPDTACGRCPEPDGVFLAYSPRSPVAREAQGHGFLGYEAQVDDRILAGGW